MKEKEGGGKSSAAADEEPDTYYDSIKACPCPALPATRVIRFIDFVVAAMSRDHGGCLCLHARVTS